MITDDIFGWAEKTPSKLALRYNGHDWSYAQLAKAIGTSAAFFRVRGLSGPGTVAIAIRNLLDFWMVAPALRSLGLTTVAVPSVEIAAGLALDDLRAVVTSPRETWPGLELICEASRVPLVRVALDAATKPLAMADLSTHTPGSTILLTSGTTGSAKKVFIDAAREQDWHADARTEGRLHDRSVYNLFNFPAFTIAGFSIPMICWHFGAAVIIDQGGNLAAGMRHRDQTEALLVPSMLSAILAQPEGSFDRIDQLRLSVGAGAITEAQVEGAKTRITRDMVQYYGSTEAGGIARTALETADDRVWHQVVEGRTVQVVDETDEPLPVGQVGRLRVKNFGGVQSYLGDPKATAEFFRHGFFYTGDLAVFREDGRFSLRGRATDVINVMGHKLGVGEMESRLRDELGHDGVCIVAFHDGQQDRVSIVVETTGAIDPARLARTAFGEAGALFPMQFVTMRALPRNQMGKVMREEVLRGLKSV